MTLVLKSTRKVCVLEYDTTVVKGDDISVEAAGEEKRDVKNTGEVDVFYPADFTGTSTITITGSHEGSETGTITVP